MALRGCLFWLGLVLVRTQDRCQPVSIPLCWDVSYNQTMMPNLLGHASQEAAGPELHHFHPLVNVGCSPDLLLFLCSVYVPVCTVLDRPVPPCRSLCEGARGGCEGLMNRFGFQWPERLRCQNFPIHESGEICVGQNTTRQTFTCPPQLQVPPYLNYQLLGAKDCGAPCEASRPGGLMFFSEAERRFCQVWVGIWSALSAATSLFTILTHHLDPTRFRYPEKPVLFQSGCCFVVAVAYGAGVLLGDSVACVDRFKDDGYKMAAQGATSAGCSALFVLLYFFGMAGSVWGVVLSFSWFLSAGKTWSQEAIEAKAQLFHLVAWAVPAAQTGGVLAAGRVEGDPLTGVCYVGISDVDSLRGFVLVPLAFYLSVGTSFLVAASVSLLRIHAVVKRDGADTRKLERLMRRLVLAGAVNVAPAAAVVACCFYEQASRTQWERTWRLQTCRTFGVPCPNSNARPAAPQFIVFLVKYSMTLAAGVTSGSWIWTEKTLKSWRDFYKRLSSDGQRETTV
ncbi:frizzled-7-like [Mugil cephalus]|uniref:frizzled-7-like n=1 Tax=Mugil cephalus TaxID=48193 RepID=UPI001FB5CC94|nr:frizzled-7-like [Mugil cephalus]